MNTNHFSQAEIEEIVAMVRLSLYNQGRLCGAHAILKELVELHVRPLPSLSTIKRILNRYVLTLV